MDNPILFRSGDSAWTLGGVLIALGFALLFVWVVLLPVVVRKLNIKARRLDSQEAATLAMRRATSSPKQPSTAMRSVPSGATRSALEN